MLNTNKKMLVKLSVQGKIHHPLGANYRISSKGVPRILPAQGGISYNVKVGDSVFGWEGDHVEPGVSIKNDNREENDALMTLSCIGNEAKVISGDAKGAIGYVTGMHGGIDHVLICFKQKDLENMAIDDKIIIKAYGQGLKLEGYKDVHLMNIDPDLFDKIGIEEKDGKLQVPIVAEVPAYLMGSGLGAESAYNGDYDIMTSDMEEIKRLGLEKLKFGDLVLLEDCDNSYGRGYLRGAVSIGVIIHSNCIKAGHGPGVTTIMVSQSPIIEGVIDECANIGRYIS